MSDNIPFKFSEITYDLAQNLLNFEKQKVVSLKQHSLILFIAQNFKGYYKDDLRRWLDAQNKFQRSSCEEVRKLWEHLESKMHCEIKLYEESISKDPIPFMALQVYDIIIKHDYDFKKIKLQDIILRNLYFTSHGTINISKTVAGILRTLPVRFASKIVFISTDPQMYSDYIYDIRAQRRHKSGEGYLQFWKESCLEMKDNLEVQSLTKSFFLNAIENNNEIAVHYIWEEYISGMKDVENVLRGSLQRMEVYKNINIFMYLMFQVKTTGLFKNFIPYSYELIIESIKNLRWRPLSVIIFNVFKCFLGEMDKFNIMAVLSDTPKFDYIAKVSSDLLRDYFESLNEKEQNFIAKTVFEPDQSHSENSILKIFIDEREDFVKLLLKAGNDDENIKRFFTSISGRMFFLWVVGEKKLEFVTNILKFHFKDGITDLKREILESIPLKCKIDLEELVHWCKSEG